jgi:hypothetical protein
MSNGMGVFLMRSQAPQISVNEVISAVILNNCSGINTPLFIEA